MNSKFNLIVLALVVTLFSCKKETPVVSLSDYKYADKGLVLNCDGMDSKLINEALFAFEDDISSFYGKTSPNSSLQLAYAQFMRDALSDRAIFSEIATPHTVEVFNVLKTKNDLWNMNNNASHLDYDSAFFNCIANNIQDKNLNTTLHALIETNSMSPKLFGAPLSSRYITVLNDKYLAAYFAFDLFYAKLFDVDLTQVKEREPQKVDFNLIPTITP
ncbi:hypothetical protein [Confluentibacter citreus]|uniref:hypothetical protein n=1 Tax=Confluentibacter citreus TaxID=2007307 RepID=UPI0012FD39F5|nr:hypothetical protein [Confluentibacter citreus]